MDRFLKLPFLDFAGIAINDGAAPCSTCLKRCRIWMRDSAEGRQEFYKDWHERNSGRTARRTETQCPIWITCDTEFIDGMKTKEFRSELGRAGFPGSPLLCEWKHPVCRESS